ncbi:MAG TPA: hypothetical protein GXX30_08575 [Firmicutes bacterium]|nr:hypothetical protein [Candidatus Fermentithermobacillaceae bacterium]
MLCMVEIFCEGAVFYDDTSYIEVILERNGIPLEDTVGYDRFLFNGAVLPGKRISATGRACRHNVSDCSAGMGLGILDIPGGRPAFLSLDSGDDLRLRVKTNLTLDVGVFTKLFSVRLQLNDAVFDIPLNQPNVEIEWAGRGEYVVSLEPFVVQALTRVLV